MNRPIRDLPLLTVDFRRNWLRQEGYELIIIFAPWPAIEWPHGEMIPALLNAWVEFLPRRPFVRFHAASRDPACRPIGESGPPARMDADDPEFEPRPIKITLDGMRAENNCVAYDRHEGWIERVGTPKCVAGDWIWSRERLYGKVEAAWQ